MNEIYLDELITWASVGALGPEIKAPMALEAGSAPVVTSSIQRPKASISCEKKDTKKLWRFVMWKVNPHTSFVID